VGNNVPKSRFRCSLSASQTVHVSLVAVVKQPHPQNPSVLGTKKKGMSDLFHIGQDTSAQQAIQTLTRRQVRVKLRLPQPAGSGKAECDDTEMMGNTIRKGGGTKEAPGCRLTIEQRKLSEARPR